MVLAQNPRIIVQLPILLSELVNSVIDSDSGDDTGQLEVLSACEMLELPFAADGLNRGCGPRLCSSCRYDCYDMCRKHFAKCNVPEGDYTDKALPPTPSVRLEGLFVEFVGPWTRRMGRKTMTMMSCF